MEVITKVLASPIEDLKAPDFILELTKEAAQKNFLLLLKHDFNMDKALKFQRGIPLEYGSEFRCVEVHEELFGRHPNWGHLEQMLQRGLEWPMEELNTKTQHKDLLEAIAFGNHKGAKKM